MPDTKSPPSKKLKSQQRPSFSDVGHAEALRLAKSMIPFLKEHAAAQEETTHMTDEVKAAFHENGLFRYMQPRYWGGMELPYVSMVEINYLLGQGDASSAWTFTNLSGHHRLLTLWSMQCQEEIWGDDPDVSIASGIAYFQGRGRRVDGGLELSGKWGFSSGVDVSEWNMLACVVYDGDKPVDWVMSMVPRKDYEIIDDWQTLGMRGTGSRSVRCENVFVPEHRVQSMAVALPGHEFSGLKVHKNPIYRIPLSGFGGYGIGGCMIGNAQGALDEMIKYVKVRSTSYTGANMRDFQAVQHRVALAAGKIDAALQWLRHDCIEANEVVDTGGTFDILTKHKYRRNAAMAVKMATEAIDMLHEMAGANGIYDSAPIQRRFRDAHAAAGHINFSMDTQLPNWGLVAMGGDFKSPTF
jgi:3-hydroxy-9,10-secoandrosta-1,3,5(10)-triene-9,17-dione monooxygenase